MSDGQLIASAITGVFIVGVIIVCTVGYMKGW